MGTSAVSKKRPSDSAPDAPPRRLWSEADAKAELAKRIEEGRQILNLQILQPAQLDDAESRAEKWADFNYELLRQIFDTREYADSYSMARGTYVRNPYDRGAQRYHDLQESVRNQIGKLESISELLQLIPEATRAAMPVAMSLESLIRDDELRRRCLDLVAAARDHDRAIREASVLLEDRIRKRLGGSAKDGVKLMSEALNATDGRLVLSSRADEQEAAHALFRGVAGFLRNPSTHKLDDQTGPEEALRVVVIVDYMLKLVARATEREPAASNERATD